MISLLKQNIRQSVYSSPILIVDDNELNRAVVEKSLRSRGFTKLLSVGSAHEALKVLPVFAPDLVILDIIMPVMDGFECCAQIRKQERFKDIPILVQTVITEPELRVRAFSMGAIDFLSKPIYPDELCARVMVHLEKRHSFETLRLYKERMQAELEGAQKLQETIIPREEEIELVRSRCGLAVASHFQTSSELGGDFWGMRNLLPDQVALWTVDFSGHGVASSLNTFRLHAYINEFSPVAARPGEYLTSMNDKMLQLVLRGQFATMFYGVIDTRGDTLFYACACAPHPILLRRKTGKAELIDGTGKPLGISSNVYTTKDVPFAPGDVLVLYSDALVETPDANGRFITEEQIANLLERERYATAADIKQALLAFFESHRAGELTDDLTLVVCMRS